jgi:glycerol-3-phosphate O-acyltransferase
MKFMTRNAVAHEVLNSERFQAELAVVANKVGKGLTEARKEAYIALRALVSVQIPFFEFLFDRGLGPLHTRAWFLDVDWAALKRLQGECKQTAGVPADAPLVCGCIHSDEGPSLDPYAPQLRARR